MYLSSIFVTVLATWIGSLCAWGLDFAVTFTRRVTTEGVLDFAIMSLGLYLLVGLLTGIVLGTIYGALRASFGDRPISRAFRQIWRNADLDDMVTSLVFTTLIVGLLYVGFIAQASIVLVGEVERYAIGAWLLGGLAFASLLAWIAIGLPVFRMMDRVTQWIPRFFIPKTVVVVTLGLIAGALACGFIVFTKLDWRAINMDGLLILGVFVIATGMIRILLCWIRPDRMRTGLKGGCAALAILFTVGCIWLSRSPSQITLAISSDSSMAARWLVARAQTATDFDGDGYGRHFGGGDCDDNNPAVHPSAEEIAANGIDDDCQHGDRPARKKSSTRQKTAPSKTDQETTPAPQRADNVFILTVDTLRADRLGIAGYRRDQKSLTPNLDAFAKNATHFATAYAQAPNTPRSFPSLFTSRFPSQVAVDKSFSNYSKVLDENLTVFEHMQKNEIRTLGFSSHFYFNEKRGIRQGFDEYNNDGATNIADSNKDIASPRIVPRVIDKLNQLAASKRRFAMFVHLFEPHSTYVKHPEYPITEKKVPGLIQKYDYEIAYVDQWIGKLFDALESTQLAHNTLVVVLSDHGEAFGIHRRYGKKMFFHGQTLYDELLRVPLLIRLPNKKTAITGATNTVKTPVMLIDVAPTILAALGLSVPPSFVGRSLLPAFTGAPLPAKPAYGELIPAPSWNHAAKMMVTKDGRYKLLSRISDRRFELYNLDEDPKEQTDISKKDPARLEATKKQLLEWTEVELPSR